MKKVISVILAVLMTSAIVMAFASCSNNSKTADKGTEVAATTVSVADVDYIKQKGTLVVGMTEYAPMNYKDKTTKEWTGFDTEFAQAVGKELGVKVEFVVIDWDNKWSELKSKSIDCVWNGMTITDEAKQNSAVSDPYVKNAQVVVMKSSEASKYTKLEDMAELTFAVESGSAGEGVLKDAKMTNYTGVTAQSDALMEVQSGSSDACIIDLTMANAMTGGSTSYKDLKQVVTLNEEEYGISFRQGSDLCTKVNEIMASMKKDGSLKKIADKYSLTLA